MSLTFPVRSGLRVPRVVVRTGVESGTARPWEVEHLTRGLPDQQQQDVAAFQFDRRLSVIVEGFFSRMRSSIRTVIVVAVAAALVVVFLRNVDLRGVLSAIVRADVRWLAVSLVAAVLSIVIRSLRWQY